MKKSNERALCVPLLKKTKRIMKLTTLFSLGVACCISASTYAQSYKLSMNKQNSSIIEILKDIEKNSEFTFFFNDNRVNVNKKASINVKDATLDEALAQILKNTGYNYQIIDRQVLIKIASSSVSSMPGVQQNQKGITGIIKDVNGEPIIGANVVEKGTTNGTVTDIEGRFSLNVASDATLIISYIGYVTIEIPTGGKKNVTVTMKEDSEALDEVIVVGYGTQKKANLTGSVEAVKGQELTKRPVMSTSLALQGLASGVTVTSNSGQPGKEGEAIRIRGIGTMNNNDPLVLVDGVASSLNAVNPNDIESISILKDAASSSIYGSRASNGVILITTKRAKTNDFAINFSANVGLQTPVDLPKFLGAIDYLELYDLASANDNRNDDGTPGGVVYGADYINNYKANMATDPYRYPNTDWAKVTYKTPAVQQSYNLSMSGGTDKLKAFVSMNVQDQEGIFPDTKMDRYSLRVNTDYKFSEKFSAGIDFSGRYSNVEEPYGADFAMGEVRRTAPIYGTVNEFGQLAYAKLGTNTYATSRKEFAGYAKDRYHEGLVNFKASYKPFDFLSFDLSYAPKFNWKTTKKHQKMIDYYDADGNKVHTYPMKQTLDLIKEYTLNQDVKFLINFQKSFGMHNLTALAGFQQITNYWENEKAYREGSKFSYDQLNAFPVLNQRGEGEANEWALQSYFGRVNYDFNGKYLLEANVRYDGSSRFASGHKWGVFPSFSAGWRFSEESFMDNIDWLDNAKLRGSWGTLGNQEGLGSNYPFSMDINLNQQVVFNQLVAEGYAANDYAMRDITWETTEMADIGLDLGFFNNRLNVVFDYYIKTTRDILMSMDIPAVMGYGNQPKQNAGKVRNKGWDLNVTWNDQIGDFYYRVAASLSDVKNEVIDMKGIVKNFDNIFTNREGYPLNSLWGLQADGLFPTFADARNYGITQYGKLQGGDVKYIDQPTIDTDGDGVPDAGDGVITGDDYVVMGNTIPRYTYSLDLAMQYKGFDLGLFFQGVGKRDSYIRDDLAWAFNNAGNVQEWQKEGMWQEGMTDAAYPRMFIASANNIKPSTYWKQNGAYLRLKNIQLGYTLPQSLLGDFFIKGARFYVSCQNLLTFDHMISGYDPEQKENGARNTMPLVKTYSFGFNLNF